MNKKISESPNLKHRSLERSLMQYLLLFGMVVTLILGAIEIYRSYKADLEIIHDQFDHIESGFLKGVTNSLWIIDHDLAQIQIDGIRVFPNIEYVELRSADELFVRSGEIPKEVSTIVRKYDLINDNLSNPLPLGKLIVIADLSKVHKDVISNVGHVLLYVGLTIFLILLLLSSLVKKLILQHFEKISLFMEETTWENIELPLELNRKKSDLYEDELDVLVNSFNSQRVELNRKHKQLLTSESRYLELADGSLQGMFIHVDFEPVFVNDACVKMFGFENKKEFLATGNFLQHLAPYERERVIDLKERRLSGEHSSSEYEVDCLHKNGSILHILVITSVIEWEDGSAILGTFMNITERKKAERELRLSEERLSKIFESSPDVIVVSRLSDGMVLDANENFELIFGHSKSDWAGKTTTDLKLWARQEDRPKIMEEIQANGGIKYWDTQYRKKNNDISDCYLSADVTEIKNELCLVITIRDISEQKAIQRALTSSEEKLSKIYESIPDLILVIRNEDGVIIDTNKNVFPVLGFTKKEVIGKTALELNAWVNLDDRTTIMSGISNNGFVKYLETQYRKKDGVIADCYISASAITIKNESCIVVTIRDITEQKVMQNLLSVSEEKFSKAFRSNPQVYVIARINEEIIETNAAFEKLSGWTREEVLGKTSRELGMWEDMDEHAAVIREMKTIGSIRNKEIIFKTKSGETRVGELSCEVINLGGKPCFLSIVNDISKRIQAEQALRESEERLLKVFESSPDTIIVSQLNNGVIIDVNKNFELLFQHEKSHVIGKTAAELDIWAHDEDRSEVVNKLKSKGYVKYLDSKYRKSNGEEADCYISAEIVEINGQACAVTTIRDITEQKAMQSALSLSEEKFSKAFRASPILFIITRVSDATIIESNEAFEKLSGWTHEEAIGKTTIELKVWNPEERARVVEEIHDMGFIKSREVRLFTKLKEARYGLLSSEIIDIDGDPCYLSIVDDITDRKRASDEILQSRERLRHLANRLEQVREEERVGIARELHDELGQALTGLKFDLTWVADQIPNAEPTSKRINSMLNNIDSSVDVVRRISSELRPPILDDLGIDAAIEWATEKFTKRTNIAHKLKIDCDDLEMNETRNTVVFRIYQETLTNIARHSGAKNFEANVCIIDNELKLTVIDDGIGITKKQIKDNNSIGLIGMQERAASIGATISITKAKTGGTEVNLTVPLND